MSYRKTNSTGHIERRGNDWRVVIEAGSDPASGGDLIMAGDANMVSLAALVTRLRVRGKNFASPTTRQPTWIETSYTVIAPKALARAVIQRDD